MPRTAEAVQKIRDERREQIIQAALQVFARRGFAATKITDVAAAAGISHGLVNHYFASKEELYHAIVVDTLDGALRVTADALQQPGSAWERLQWLCGEMLDGIRRTPEYSLVMTQIRISAGTSESIKTLLAYYSENIQRNIAALFAQGQQSGEITAGDPAQFAILLTALISGLALAALHPDDRVQLIPTQPDFLLRLFSA